jgi:manganese/zinc/iron transport system permease protein
MFQTSWAVIGAFRAVGVLLVLSFLVGPILMARLFAQRFKKMIFLAAFFGSAASLIGVALSRHLLTVYHLPLSTAGLTVCVIGSMYVFSLLYCKISRAVTMKTYND